MRKLKKAIVADVHIADPCFTSCFIEDDRISGIVVVWMTRKKEIDLTRKPEERKLSMLNKRPLVSSFDEFCLAERGCLEMFL